MTKQDVWNWFYNSAVIVWARFQVLMGCVVLVITQTDMAQWLPEHWMPYWLVINGVVSEYLRRTGTQTSTIEVQSNQMQGLVSQKITYLQPPNPVPEGARLVNTQIIKRYSGSSVFGMVGISFGLLAAVFMILFLIK